MWKNKLCSNIELFVAHGLIFKRRKLTENFERSFEKNWEFCTPLRQWHEYHVSHGSLTEISDLTMSVNHCTVNTHSNKPMPSINIYNTIFSCTFTTFISNKLNILIQIWKYELYNYNVYDTGSWSHVTKLGLYVIYYLLNTLSIVLSVNIQL